MRRNGRCAALALALTFLSSALPAAGQAAADARLNELLETVLRAHGVPALAAAIVTSEGLAAAGAAGVRKAGTDAAATIDDEWHIGSDTKAMTAVMIGALVERNTLTWETTPADVFPDLAATMTPAFRRVTLLHLLSHRAGLPANAAWGLIPRTRSTREQRLVAFRQTASSDLLAEPGAKFLYSNLGYVIAGAMAERAADSAWEDLMRSLVFDPLGMTGAGFGGTGTPGRLDQPWGHTANGKPVASNGPDTDNPPVMGPAGTVHCTLRDWANFIADQLRGARGEEALLREETYKRLQTPPFGGDYALGWLTVERDWGGGTVLTHSGSNTMNFAVAWLAPRRGFAVIVVCNQGGPTASKACDDAASRLVRLRVGE